MLRLQKGYQLGYITIGTISSVL